MLTFIGYANSQTPSDMKSIMLDIISALYQRPIFTMKLLFTHGFKKFSKPIKSLVTSITPYSVQLRYAAFMLFLLGNNENNNLSNEEKKLKKNETRKRRSNHRSKKNNHKNKDMNEKDNQEEMKREWSLKKISSPVSWVMEGTQNILQNGLSFLNNVEDDEIRSQHSASTTSTTSSMFTPNKKTNNSSKKQTSSSFSTPLMSTPTTSSTTSFWDEDIPNKASYQSPPIGKTSTSASTSINGKHQSSMDNISTPQQIPSQTTALPTNKTVTRQTRRQKSSRASFSSPSTILSGGGGAW